MKIADVTSSTVCNICGRRADAPYREIHAGRIVNGCVARMHDAHVVRPSNSSGWIADAKRSFRAAGVKRLAGIGGK